MARIVEAAPEPASSTAGSTLIALRGVYKVFTTGRLEFHALRGVDLDIKAGEFTAIVGPSGSGKSTLLNIMTGIDRPSEGSVVVGGRQLHGMSEEELAVWRGNTVGIVFQFFQLLPTLTALENAMLPMDLARDEPVADRRERARRNLERVGLAAKADHLPMELSGGEQQRVAIARALARDPPILVGDEPTGNLDTETAAKVFELLAELHRQGTTVIYVTHDSDLAAHASRVIGVRDGLVVGSG